MKEHCFYWLASSDLLDSAPFFTQSRTTHPGMALSMVDCALLHQLAIKKVPPYILTGNSSAEVPFSQICQVDKPKLILTSSKCSELLSYLSSTQDSFLANSNHHGLDIRNPRFPPCTSRPQYRPCTPFAAGFSSPVTCSLFPLES